MTSDEKYLEFALGEELYAIPILTVREVLAVPDITPVPFTNGYFKGISNLRGLIISVMDLREKFGIKSKPSKENVVVLCDFSGVSLGVIVDSVNNVLSINREEIKSKPDIKSSVKSDYILGIVERNSKLIMLVDIAQILNVNDRNTINKMAAA